MSRVGVAVLGLGMDGQAILACLQQFREEIHILGVAPGSGEDAGAVDPGKFAGLFFPHWRQLLGMEGLEVVIDTCGEDATGGKLPELCPANVSVLDGKSVDLFLTLVQKLDEVKHLKGELSAIFNSVQEAIEVVDKNGIIRYVNPAFSRVTGIPEPYRVGQNIFEVSPHGALAEAFIRQKTVAGRRTKVGGSEVEVISNAAPIIVDGQIQGAVVVFQPINDILKLMDELKQSNSIIASLYARIGQITGSKYSFDDLKGQGKIFRATVEMAKKAARSNTTVLISGESGTGKELFAHAMHQASSRRDNPFIKVNCAAIPDSLLESEFFGHEKGAFTGAVRTKLGKVELANGGTLFLDEIGDMNMFLQAKLLRFLQEMEFERVGGTQTIKVDVRVIAATNRNLKAMIRRGAFREDLYYRLNVVELNIPPLRQHKEDISCLVASLIAKFNRKLGRNVKGITDEAMQLLFNYDWPGNVRELENVIERAMVVTDDDWLGKKQVMLYVGILEGGNASNYLEVMPLEKMEQMMLKAALARYGTSLDGKKRAAQALNISLATLYNKLKRYKTTVN